MEENVCECCQDKTDTIESFLAEYDYYVNRDELTVDMFIEMLVELYDDAHRDGRTQALEEIADGVLAMAYGAGYDDLS